MTAPPSRRFLPFLLVLFAATGCASLIYEIVWFQLLQLVIGSSAVSLGVLLGTFMGGMCAGSLGLPRLVSARRHPLRVYAVLEAGIGICGLAVLYGMPLIDRFYAAVGGQGFAGILVRGAVCSASLLAPTFLMGASLPAISRWIETTPRGVSWLGFFYGGNIAGAVLGCLLAGFYLLRVHDTATATWVAASINAAAALLSWTLASRAPHEAPAEAASGEPGPVARVPQATGVYLAIGLSGMCALSSEVVWTRLLSLILGGTVYTFSIILSVFLTGLGVGSAVGSVLSRDSARPRIALGLCQAMLVGAIAWSAWMLTGSLPYWPVNPSLSTSPWFNFQIDLVRCLWAIFPATLLWGASFPLALAAVAGNGKDPGKLVGGMYAANTAGAIVGAVGVAMIGIPVLGTQQCERLVMGLSVAGALFAFAPYLRSVRGIATAGAVTALAVLLAWKIPPVPWKLVAHGRQLPTSGESREFVYMGEGMNASIAVTRIDKMRMFHVSGKVEASSQGQDMRLQRMLAHVPGLLHGGPRSVLVVGFGAGVTSGTFVTYPTLDRLVICEIEPLIPKTVALYFGKENYHVVRDPRAEIVYDDGRHFVRTTREKFDIITSDPIHPWVKGNAALYTKEYFEMCKRRLNPGGFVTQWVPLYESDLDTVKSEIATFFEVFPNGTIWSNDFDGEGYDVVLLGSNEDKPIDLGEIQQRLQSARYAPVAESLRDVGFATVVGLLSTYGGRAQELRPWLRNAEINHDRNLRLQYLAGMGVNNHGAVFIYDEIVKHRIFPEDLFRGPADLVKELREALGL